MKRYTYLIPFILLIIDYNINTLINKPLLCTLLCWYLLQLYAPKRSPYTLAGTIGLLGLASFLHHGYFGFIYLSLMPATLLSLFCQHWLTSGRILPMLSLLLTLVLNNLAITHILGLPVPLKNYTIWQFFVNILVLLGMSLKIHGDGRQGNRL